ncbi:MAG: 50S ribosomal protein L11 [Patescibacteria group bacterium]
MAKVIKLQIMAGKANPAPPVGPALGQAGLNIQEFCLKFNAATNGKEGIIPVEIIVAEDKTYELVFHTPPASELIKKYAKIQKGSGNALLKKAGKLSKTDLKTIAEIKIPDLNTENVEQAMKIVAGTARQMGVEIVD